MRCTVKPGVGVGERMGVPSDMRWATEVFPQPVGVGGAEVGEVESDG
jgi:hypothetical protein